MNHNAPTIVIGAIGVTIAGLLFGIAQPAPLNESAVDHQRLPLLQTAFVEASATAVMLTQRDWTQEDPSISASAALIVDSVTGISRPYFSRNPAAPYPAASIIKLLTALTVREELPLETTITITRADIAAPEAAGGLHVGEEMNVRTLLAAMLVESSNDAAHALARTVEHQNGRSFRHIMQATAYKHGLQNIYPDDPMGLSPQTSITAFDAAMLLHKVLQDSELAALIARPRYEAPGHVFSSTHALFDKIDGVIGAKTGYIPEVGQNIVLRRKTPDGRYITTVVLGSKDRERDTIELQQWAEKAFRP